MRWRANGPAVLASVRREESKMSDRPIDLLPERVVLPDIAVCPSCGKVRMDFPFDEKVTVALCYFCEKVHDVSDWRRSR